MSRGFDAAARTLAETWRDEFGKVMLAMADLQPQMDLAPEEAAPPSGILWWKQSFSLGDGAVIWAGFPEPSWERLGRQILSAAGIESTDSSEIKSTFLEVLRQSFGSVANILTAQLDREVLAADGAEQEPHTQTPAAFGFTLRVADEDLPGVSLAIDTSLLEILSRRESPDPVQAPANAEAAAADAAVAPHPTLEILMDVEMPVSVSFGRTQIRLQDVLKLITGSIIELDRRIVEPVEVVVNNCVIARGEVVVVDGNYGVRIQEIVSRRERLQQSRRYMLPAQRNAA
jgi:flagellar motor switch protein FliN/FliY